MILKDHPEIRQLFGHEPLTAVIGIGLSAINFWVMTWISDCSSLVYWFLTWAVSGTINHSLQLVNHDISHNLAFGPENINANLALGIFANLVSGVPSSVAFRYYHYDHHMKQGVDGEDTDITSKAEIKAFRSTFGKFLWVLCMPFFYAVRPLVIKPRPPTVPQIINFVVQVSFNAWVYKEYGAWALGYFVFGALLGIAFHPCAGHFIAEHFEFMKGFETYSYYGSCNFFNLCVGYHNEHHDFPKVPWSRLHKVKEIAPEYYDHLPHHTSYLKMYYHFLFDDNIGTWSRVKRENKRRNKKKN